MSDDLQRFEAQEPASRDEMLMLVEEAARECHSKAAGKGRIRSIEKDRMRKGYCDSLASLANAYRRLQKDKELEEMEREIKELQEQESRISISGRS